MKNKSKNGISLIVLVITIIVMIILAGAIIVTLSNTGVIEKAQQAVDTTNASSIETLAATLWADAYLDGARTDAELEKAVKDGLAANKITEADYPDYKLEVTAGGVKLNYIDPAQNPKGTIPTGGVYYVGVTSTAVGDYTGATATYNAGDNFPETVTAGDVYVFGDYEYRYGYKYDCPDPAGWVWTTSSEQGWGVRVTDTTKASYGTILSSINNKPITTLVSTFYNCEALINLPNIPETVTNIKYLCHKCTALVSASEIPESVLDMQLAFAYCPSLTGIITINANPTSYGHCFRLDSAGKDITLAGTCTAETKQNLANTSDSSYRKVYDESGTLLK